jgi:carbonic anhydrase
MRKLIKGIVDFRQHFIAEYRAKFSTLALGQNPDTLFIACCDSRVVPNTFASSDPGDLFVVRNIGNLVPPSCQGDHDHKDDNNTSVAAAIEYSILKLNVSDIVICGHSECGAMLPFVDQTETLNSPSVNSWLLHAAPSYERYLQQPHTNPQLSPQNALSQCNVIQQIEHLKTYPLVQERMLEQKIRLHGWWFDLATADVHYFNPETHSFVLIDNAEAENIFATI